MRKPSWKAASTAPTAASISSSTSMSVIAAIAATKAAAAAVTAMTRTNNLYFGGAAAKPIGVAAALLVMVREDRNG